jgi:putative glutamine amidotransferase
MGHFMSPESHYRPRVGVPYRTRKEELTENSAELKKYLGAIATAGGHAVEVSLALSSERIKEFAQTLDAVVLTGSPADVRASLFCAIRHPKSAEPDRDRERIDFALLEHSLAEHKPVLAICYGIQSLNVFLGGTLIQDIPSELHTEVRHDGGDGPGSPETFHAVRFEPGSRLEQMAGALEVRVNSSHHQSILEPGRDLRIVSRAPDGVIEAVEWNGDANWVLGVQWHPERMVETESLAQELFRHLVEAARRAPLRA